ncbi:MAG: histidine--tRNA ligase [Clostridiales bacterium]|nr:histidine--tRNA ligase [Clostridiales bacterium]
MLLTQAPRGTRDVLPDESYLWQLIEKTQREVCALHGIREVRTPVFEHTELFQRSVGDTTDVVQKEMYTFKDRGDRSITLKPEGTAGTVRAFIESSLYAQPLPQKMCYINCPVFRYEAPQSGRLREHHQFGIEIFGAPDASCDAELISLALDVIGRMGVKNLMLRINSIGCPECRETYKKRLIEFLNERKGDLCKDCLNRLERNPLRVLDCKEEGCKRATVGAPSILDNLCDECKTHFENLKRYLDAMGIKYEVDSRIVRGLDYYTKTVFEIITKVPGENGKPDSELTVCGGGRYDGLVEQVGGPKCAGIGFGMGTERLIMVMKQQGVQPEPPRLYDAFIVTMGDDARVEGIKLARELRANGIKCDIDHAARSMKAQFKYANKLGAPVVAVIAGDELAQGVVKIKDMAKSEEHTIARADVAAEIKKMLG